MQQSVERVVVTKQHLLVHLASALPCIVLAPATNLALINQISAMTMMPISFSREPRAREEERKNSCTIDNGKRSTPDIASTCEAIIPDGIDKVRLLLK